MANGWIHVKRVYEAPSPDDGLRVLVDRLWPRGVGKDRVDLWLKDAAPSAALRREFHARPERWEAFLAAYREELRREPARSAAFSLAAMAASQTVTLLFAARDETRNNAVALEVLLADAKR